MLSDAYARMKPVVNAMRGEREADSGIGFADQLDVDDVDRLRGLAHMDVLRERLDAWIGNSGHPAHSLSQTAAANHLRETGHRLGLGCCSPAAQARRLTESGQRKVA